MDFIRNIEPVAVYVSLALEALVIGRLAQSRLTRRYRFFALYLGADIARTLMLILVANLDWHSRIYLWSWIVSAPIVWVTLALATIELFEHIHSQFEREKSRDLISKAMLFLGSVMAIALSALIGGLRDSSVMPLYRLTLTIQRCVFFGCALLLLGQLAFFALAKLRLPTNLSVHRWLLSLYVVSLAAKRFASSASDRRIAEAANLLQILVGCGCFVAWVICLKPNGETKPETEPISRAELAEIVDRYEKSKELLKFGNR